MASVAVVSRVSVVSRRSKWLQRASVSAMAVLVSAAVDGRVVIVLCMRIVRHGHRHTRECNASRCSRTTGDIPIG